MRSSSGYFSWWISTCLLVSLIFSNYFCKSFFSFLMSSRSYFEVLDFSLCLVTKLLRLSFSFYRSFNSIFISNSSCLEAPFSGSKWSTFESSLWSFFKFNSFNAKSISLSNPSLSFESLFSIVSLMNSL